MSPSSGSLFTIARSSLPGVVTAIGVAAILFARNWWMLAVGWAVLGVFFVLLLGGLLRSKPAPGPVRFRVGPSMGKNALASRRWLVPVGVFILLLGVFAMFVGSNESTPAERFGWGIFLVGVGVGCFGIASANRFALAAGYALWSIAGLTMAVLAARSGGDAVETARLMTVGILCALGGGAAAWKFFRGTTPVYDDGIRYGSTLCGWDTVDSWSITGDGRTRLLTLTVGDGRWKQVHDVANADVTDLEAFLHERIADHKSS
ncbi:hypothetical protein [Maioricimonas sp. JC845]|uniref:hypothetical protein n=1 Tax=Maioricimonas sp. JC845 TaxID=3232138 RepID=UPI00345A1884